MIRFSLGVFAALALMHLLGWREEVSFLSGTVPVAAGGLACGLAYALTWFAAVLVAPVLLVAGVVGCGVEAWRAGSAGARPREPHGLAAYISGPMKP